MEKLEEKEFLEKTMQWLEVYETTKDNYLIKESQCQLLINLVERNIDIFTIMDSYKQVLCNTSRYDHNYYAHICILLNLMVIRKKTKNLDLSNSKLQDFDYVEEAVKENIEKSISNKVMSHDYRLSMSIYAWLDYEEEIGEEKTKNEKKNVLEEANALLNLEVMDIKRGKACIKELKRYIIQTYGRWSYEYKEVLELEADLVGYPLTPNLVMMALRYNIKRDIIRLLHII